MTSPAPPVTEKGYVSPVGGTLTGWAVQYDQFEQNAELLWPNSIRIFTRMGREDGRLASVLQAMTLPVRRTAWRIDPNGARDEVVELVATDLGLTIVGADENLPTPRMKGRFSWSSHLRQALTYLQFGHSIFETIYRLDGGRVRLERLSPRPQSSIAYWSVARNGDLMSIEQWPAGLFVGPGISVQAATSTGGGVIPGDRLVVYVRDPDPGVWTGASILRPAYKHWIAKDELMRIEIAAARRHGIGVPVAYTPPQLDSDPDQIAEYQKIASAFRGGSSAGAAFPSEARFEILSPSGTPMDPRRAIEYHDHQMAIASLAHFLNLDGKGGSYALASVQADTFVQSVSVVADTIRDTMQAAVVEPLVDWNFGADEPAPRIVFDEIGSRQDATAAALQMLVNAGLLTPDQRLESFVRSASGLPAADLETQQGDPADTPAVPMPANRTRTRANDPTLW